MGRTELSNSRHRRQTDYCLVELGYSIQRSELDSHMVRQRRSERVAAKK